MDTSVAPLPGGGACGIPWWCGEGIGEEGGYLLRGFGVREWLIGLMSGRDEFY